MQQRFYKEFERDFSMKIILIIIPTSLVTKLLLSLFCPFVETKKQDQIFSKLVIWQREIFLFFVYSESSSTSKICRIQYTFIKRFCYMLFLLLLKLHYQIKLNAIYVPKLFSLSLRLLWQDIDIKMGHSNFRTILKNHFQIVKQMGKLLKEYLFLVSIFHGN